MVFTVAGYGGYTAHATETSAAVDPFRPGRDTAEEMSAKDAKDPGKGRGHPPTETNHRAAWTPHPLELLFGTFGFASIRVIRGHLFCSIPAQPAVKIRPRYSVGDWPTIFLKTRLKWVSDWNPTS